MSSECRRSVIQIVIAVRDSWWVAMVSSESTSARGVSSAVTVTTLVLDSSLTVHCLPRRGCPGTARSSWPVPRLRTGQTESGSRFPKKWEPPTPGTGGTQDRSFALHAGDGVGRSHPAVTSPVARKGEYIPLIAPSGEDGQPPPKAERCPVPPYGAVVETACVESCPTCFEVKLMVRSKTFRREPGKPQHSKTCWEQMQIRRRLRRTGALQPALPSRTRH